LEEVLRIPVKRSEILLYSDAEDVNSKYGEQMLKNVERLTR
jgi:hypothetical protein